MTSSISGKILCWTFPKVVIHTVIVAERVRIIPGQTPELTGSGKGNRARSEISYINQNKDGSVLKDPENEESTHTQSEVPALP